MSRDKLTSLGKWLLFQGSIGFGLGKSPIAPGTVGTLGGLPVILVLEQLNSPLWANIGLLIALLLIGIPICRSGIRHFGTSDPKQVVYDEIAAYPLALLFVPVTLMNIILGFVLFRLFDILKPWPISQCERVAGAWGVMLDDTAAGLLSGLCLWLIVVNL